MPQSEVCDFRQDCLHNTDEENCGEFDCDFLSYVPALVESCYFAEEV